MEFDLSQAEIRGIGSMAKDDKLAEAYAKGLDIHRYIASVSLHIPYDKVTDKERKSSKAISFAILYGSSAKSMAKKLGCTIEEAQELINSFLRQFSSIKRFIEDQHRVVDEKQYVVGLYGRKRRLPFTLFPIEEGKRYRQAVNSPIQNLASDFNLLQLIEFSRLIKEEKEKNPAFRCTLCLTVHDSILVSTPEEWKAKTYELYKKANLAVNKYTKKLLPEWIEMKFEAKAGPNWNDTKDYHPE